jgi:hypothetical protein
MRRLSTETTATMTTGRPNSRSNTNTTSRAAPLKGRGYDVVVRACICLGGFYLLSLVVSMSYFESWQTKQTGGSFQAFQSPQLEKTTTMTTTKAVVHGRDDPFLLDLLQKAGVEESDLPTILSLFQGREPLLELLQDAGVLLDLPTILSLPKWSSVTKLYGEGPVILGLDTCEQFRKEVPQDDAFIAPAGLFNTATNTLADYLRQNLEFWDNSEDDFGGTRWQVRKFKSRLPIPYIHILHVVV